MEELTTAVVILNWNGEKLLQEFLPSVVQFSAEANIYVADNASTDDSVSFVQQNFPQIKIIQNKVNGGFAKGYNDALKNLEEDIFILLNSDVKVSQKWLPPILSVFQKDENTAVVQPKILSYKNPQYFEYAGAAGGFIDKFGYPFCRGRIFDVLEKDEGQYNDETEIFWASGACFAIKRQVFEAVGGFDEIFFAHQEEIDMCWRIKNLGWKVKYTGASKVYHLGGGTLNSLSARKTFFNFRNSLFSVQKNVPKPQVWLVICARLVLDGVAGAKFLFNGKVAHFMAILRAHFSFYSTFNKMMHKRPSEFREKKYFYIKSIIYAHFVKKKNKFSSL